MKKACNPICKIMKNAGVPNDIRWRSLVNFLRTIDNNNKFINTQKKELQDILQNIIHERTYTDEDYKKIMEKIDIMQIASSNLIKWYTKEISIIQNNYKSLKELLNEILSNFSSTTINGLKQSKERYNDVLHLKESTVKSINEEEDKSIIIDKLVKATDHILTKLNKEITIWAKRMEFSTRWKQKALEMEKIATIDSLTQVYNRRAFDIHVSKMINTIITTQQPLSLLLIDIDNFKNINDLYGHLTGDEVLKLVASIIKKTVISDKCFIARFGGEEFVILLEDTDVENAYKVAEKIRTTIENYNFNIRDSTSDNEYINFTVSIGISEIFACKLLHEKNILTLVNQNDIIKYSLMLVESADEALYLAKRTGKNITVISSDCFIEKLIVEKTEYN